jgi:hypothetical protein
MKYDSQIKQFLKNTIVDRNPAQAQRIIKNILRKKVDSYFYESYKVFKNSKNKSDSIWFETSQPSENEMSFEDKKKKLLEILKDQQVFSHILDPSEEDLIKYLDYEYYEDEYPEGLENSCNVILFHDDNDNPHFIFWPLIIEDEETIRNILREAGFKAHISRTLNGNATACKGDNYFNWTIDESLTIDDANKIIDKAIERYSYSSFHYTLHRDDIY